MSHIYQSEFALHGKLIYLNHAAVSPWPVRTLQAVQDFAQENAQFGSQNYLHWLQKEQLLRNNLAELIHAPAADDIALVKNTSEGLSMVAYGYPWQAGDNVVIPAHEFPSNRIVWESLRDKGVEIRQINLFPHAQPEHLLIAACDRNTRLLSVSSVHYANGLRLDLPQLGEHCQANNILFCIDAIQSIGAVQFDCQACNADFVIADGHKWLLGPEGLGLFYSRPEARDQLRLYEYGWHMIEHPADFNQIHWQVTQTAQRFECGSPNMLGVHALLESVSLLLEVGMENVEQQLLENTRFMLDYLQHSKTLECVSSQAVGKFAGIVSFRHHDGHQAQRYEQLMQQDIMCALRNDAIRFSPHFYTPLSHIETALQLAEVSL